MLMHGPHRAHSVLFTKTTTSRVHLLSRLLLVGLLLSLYPTRATDDTIEITTYKECVDDCNSKNAVCKDACTYLQPNDGRSECMAVCKEITGICVVDCDYEFGEDETGEDDGGRGGGGEAGGGGGGGGTKDEPAELICVDVSGCNDKQLCGKNQKDLMKQLLSCQKQSFTDAAGGKGSGGKANRCIRVCGKTCKIASSDVKSIQNRLALMSECNQLCLNTACVEGGRAMKKSKK